MSDRLVLKIEGMEFSADLIVNDMQRQFGQPHLKCVEGCGRVQFGTWGYLKTGWPKCCGYTMRLIAGRESS